MMNIQDEIRAEKASYLDWDEIRERQAEKEIHEKYQQKKTQKAKLQREQEIKEASKYMELKIGQSNKTITQEEINKYPAIGYDTTIQNAWNDMMIGTINHILRFAFDENPEITVVSEDVNLSTKSIPIYNTDMFGNELDIVDCDCEPIGIIHVKFNNMDFQIFNTNKYNIFKVVGELRYLPTSIENFKMWKYELQREEDE